MSDALKGPYLKIMQRRLAYLNKYENPKFEYFQHVENSYIKMSRNMSNDFPYDISVVFKYLVPKI